MYNSHNESLIIRSQSRYNALSISGFNDGIQAARIVKRIIVDGESPKKIGFQKSKQGVGSINLARAKTPGIEKGEIPSTILINSKVYERFSWEDEE